MQAYDDFIAGKLEQYEMPRDKIDASITRLKELYPWANS
jgi:hypothetical protein